MTYLDEITWLNTLGWYGLHKMNWTRLPGVIYCVKIKWQRNNEHKQNGIALLYWDNPHLNAWRLCKPDHTHQPPIAGNNWRTWRWKHKWDFDINRDRKTIAKYIRNNCLPLVVLAYPIRIEWKCLEVWRVKHTKAGKFLEYGLAVTQYLGMTQHFFRAKSGQPPRANYGCQLGWPSVPNRYKWFQ